MTLPDIPSFLIQHLGQDAYNGPWHAQLIRDGEFYNGHGSSASDAILSAAAAQPYIPLPRDPPADELDPLDLLTLLPHRPVYRRF